MKDYALLTLDELETYDDTYVAPSKPRKKRSLLPQLHLSFPKRRRIGKPKQKKGQLGRPLKRGSIFGNPHFLSGGLATQMDDQSTANETIISSMYSVAAESNIQHCQVAKTELTTPDTQFLALSRAFAECSMKEQVQETFGTFEGFETVLSSPQKKGRPQTITHGAFAKCTLKEKITETFGTFEGTETVLSGPQPNGRTQIITQSNREEQDDDTTVTNEGVEAVLSGEQHDYLPLLAQRLLRTGACRTSDFEFVSDKEVPHMYAIDEEKKDDGPPSPTCRIKTKVWEVSTSDDNGSPRKPFYVVTGVPTSKGMDTRKLRKAIFQQQTSIIPGQPHRGRHPPRIRPAPISIAEAMTGYKSGTMAPICHTTNMKLFLDDSVLRGDPDSNRVLCGSGIVGKCLSIRKDKLLKVAKKNPEKMEIVSLTPQKRRPRKLYEI